MRTLLLLLRSLLLLGSTAHSDDLAVTISVDKTLVRPGETINVTAVAKNTYTPRAPFEIKAEITYTDWTGEVRQGILTEWPTLKVVQPLSVPDIKIPVPPGTSYVEGSGTSIPTLSNGVLTFPLNVTLDAGESASVLFQLTSQ